MQIADIVLDAILAPAWVMQVFLLMISLGLPITIIVSWAYEITPDGIKLQSEIDRAESITGDTGRKLDMITIGLLISVVVLVGVERAFFPQAGTVDPVEEVVTPVADKSIAVLAFEDLSPDGDQAYFAEGLSEELLNVLAQVSDLNVAGRTSSFAFRGKDKDLREIGELLNVAHILEGSIRKSGNRIRVTAQLINASDGFHLFSETYDRELSDIFALQDEIAQSIATSMLNEIVGAEAVVATTRTDTETYELYLLARQRINSRDADEMREAAKMLERALEIDPIYAPALAQKALADFLLSNASGAYGDTSIDEVMPASMRLIDQAIALDGNLAEARSVRGLFLRYNNRFEESVVELELALQINPTMSDAATWLSSTYGVMGRRTEAREILEGVVERDPTFGPAFNNLQIGYLRDTESDLGGALIERVARIVGENDDVHQARGMVAMMNGDIASAVSNLRVSLAENPYSSTVRAWYGFALANIADYETMLSVGAPEHRLAALAAMGRQDEARQELAEFDIAASDPARVLTDIGFFFNYYHTSQEFIDYVLQQYGSLDTLLATDPIAPTWGSGYAGQLAYAYLQVNDEQTFRKLIAFMRDDLDMEAAAGADNWVARLDEAVYAALIGETQAALVALQTAIDGGFRNPNQLNSPLFDSLRDEPEFERMQQWLMGRVDAARESLGMPPYLPVTSQKNEEKSSGWQP